MKKSSELRTASKVFINLDSFKSEIGSASSTVFKLVYGGLMKDTLMKLR